MLLGYSDRFIDRHSDLNDPTADVVIEYTHSSEITYTVSIKDEEILRHTFSLEVEHTFTDMASRTAKVGDINQHVFH